jgi:hypothetical protein
MWDRLLAWAGKPRPYPLGTQLVNVTGDIASVDADYSANPLRSLYCGGGGNVVVRSHEDTSDTTIAVQPGTLLPIVVTRVVRSGTTATGLVGIR